MTLIQKLEEIQTRRGLSGDDFALSLNISRVAWWNIRKGGRAIGPEVLAKIVRTYPELNSHVIQYLETFPIKHERAAA